jgi:hypothetical protein
MGESILKHELSKEINEKFSNASLLSEIMKVI